MKASYLMLATLTIANAGILIFSLTQPHPAAAQDVVPLLRGRGLEIVDDQGRVRAEIKVLPADPNVKMSDGTTGYPETVLMRLMDSHNGPHVKLSATEDGSGLSLGGQTGQKGYTQLLSRRADPFIKIVANDGRERMIKP